MIITELQDEIHQWHRRNFTADDAESALLEVGEELGELMRAQLKQDGGIRGTWEEWQTEKFKEAGDVMIGLLNFLAFVNASAKPLTQEMLDYYDDGGSKLSVKMCLLSVNLCFSKLIGLYAEMVYIPSEYTIEERQFPATFSEHAYSLLLEMGYYCRRSGFDATDALLSRWKTISQRDFITNPLTGGREKEQ